METLNGLATDELLQKANTEWEQLLLPQPHGRETLLALIEAYSQKGRYYHTLQHIAEMTLLLALNRGQMSGSADAFLGCLWHDVVYDAKRNDNEELSAERWRHDAERLQIPARQIERVGEMILATKKHQPADDSSDMLLFLDADLAILGAESQRYDSYMHGVRYEYAHVPESDYRPGRSAVLKKFLERPQIYFTQIMRDQFETAARRNIRIEISTLSTKDNFYGTFAHNYSGWLTWSVDAARSSFYEVFCKYARSEFGFHTFSEPIWSPDDTIGSCSSDEAELEWGHDFFSGFYFHSRDNRATDLVRKMGDFFNSVMQRPEFNIYRHYLLIDYDGTAEK